MTRARCSSHKDAKELPLGCATCRRIQLEATIVKKTVKAMLAAGYALQVNDGESVRPDHPTTSSAAIIAELMETDDDYLMVFQPGSTGERTESRGWVRFVYGNDGFDVISDYHTDLEDILKPVNEYCDRMGG